MSEKFLLVFDSVFAFFGAFWAGVCFFRALSLGLDFVEWLLLFGIMALLLYPLIRKAVEVFFKNFEVEWTGFRKDWKKDIEKKRWEY